MELGSKKLWTVYEMVSSITCMLCIAHLLCSMLRHQTFNCAQQSLPQAQITISYWLNEVNKSISIEFYNLQDECPLGKLFLPSIISWSIPVHFRSSVILPSGKHRYKKSGLGLQQNQFKDYWILVYTLSAYCLRI